MTYQRLGMPGWELPRLGSEGKPLWDEACPWRDATLPDGTPAEGDVVAAILAGVDWARANPTRAGLIVIVDAHAFLAGPAFCRLLRDAAELLRSTQVSVVLTSPLFKHGENVGLPSDLESDVHVIRPGLPDRDELRALVEAGMATYDESVERKCSIDDVTDACRGGTTVQALDWIAQSVVQTGSIDCDLIAELKSQALSKVDGLTSEDCDDSLEHIGGMEALKAWLVARRRGLSEAARAFQMMLNGIVLVGPPGTGKSLTSRVIASIFRVPLLTLSLGEVMDKWVGGSEARIRRVLDTAEAQAPCVLRIDEIEKAMGTGDGDNGTSDRVVGMILTWLQESDAPVFVVATANDVTRLRPELLRAGRFDASWLVDLPHAVEREAIFRVHLAKRGLELPDEAIARLAERCDGYSGSEIEQAIRDARWLSDPDLEGQPITEAALGEALSEVIPLSRSMGEQIDAIRSWCKARTRPASLPPKPAQQQAQPTGRAVRRPAAN